MSRWRDSTGATQLIVPDDPSHHHPPPGYVSRDPIKNMLQLVAGVIAIASYAAARMLALGVLIVASLEHWAWSPLGLLPPLAWVLTEFGLFSTARWRNGNYHW